MTVEFPTPAPAASEQPGSPVPTTQTAFPVYAPDPNRNEVTPNKDNPLGDYHKVAQNEPGNERELLFTIGGKPLYAPHADDIDPAVGIRMIRDIRKFGVPFAVANAMGELLGDEALDLLADAPRMSKEEWAQIMNVLTDKVFSKLQDNLPGGKG